MDLSKELRKLTYGLFVLSVKCYQRDNGCIINTAIQVASNPDRIAISVNKQNLTEEMLHHVEDFTISVISEDASFELFKRFGFQSGNDVEKFEDFDDCVRTENGAYAITRGTNAYFTAHIDNLVDLGSHTLVVATLTGGKTLSDVPSATYSYYHTNIKPQSEKTVVSGKTVWRCAICGYEYEGEELPEDFICPTCKHGASDFDKVEK